MEYRRENFRINIDKSYLLSKIVTFEPENVCLLESVCVGVCKKESEIHVS